MEQVFYPVASEVAIQLDDPMKVFDCSANCPNKCTLLSGKLWRFSHDDKHYRHLFCDNACALSSMHPDNLSQ